MSLVHWQNIGNVLSWSSLNDICRVVRCLAIQLLICLIYTLYQSLSKGLLLCLTHYQHCCLPFTGILNWHISLLDLWTLYVQNWPFGSCVDVSAMPVISKADALICEIVFTLHQWKKTLHNLTMAFFHILWTHQKSNDVRALLPVSRGNI